MAAVAAMLWVGQRLAVNRAVAQEQQRLDTVATLAAANFSRQIDMFDLVAKTLSADPEVRRVLEQRSPAAIDALNQRLATLSVTLQTSVIYLMDRQGTTVVSSNWRQPDSFLGQNYGFRVYFARALAEGSFSQFALGTRSNIPGLFLARRIEGSGGPVGVLVVKVRFDRLEREWGRTIGEAFVTDPDGVILVTSRPDRRFDTVRRLSAARREELRSLLAVGQTPLSLHPDYAAGTVLHEGRDWSGERLAEANVAAAPSFRLLALSPVGPTATAARGNALVIMILIVASLLVATLGISTRRRLAAARNREREQLRIDDLKNRLEQANRLSLLGQVVAGVGHEINQPVAAIGMRAGSAVRLIDAGRGGEAKTALNEIERLIHRLGSITGELRNFSRRSVRGLGPVRVRDALDGLALLLGDSLRRQAARLEIELADEGLIVFAEQVRLEQVLVNLVQNALDAGGSGLHILITASASDDNVQLQVSNDGPAIPPEARRNLFQPFSSTKTEGLGLGLVISRDIVAEFGGHLSLVEQDGSGRTVFAIDLRRLA